MEDFSLDDKLQSLDAEGLYNLVKSLMDDNPQVRRLILEWFKKNAKSLKKVDTKKDEVFLNLFTPRAILTPPSK